jgi:hypothetical protein
LETTVGIIPLAASGPRIPTPHNSFGAIFEQHYTEPKAVGTRRASSYGERNKTMKTKTNLKAGIIAILIG